MIEIKINYYCYRWREEIGAALVEELLSKNFSVVAIVEVKLN